MKQHQTVDRNMVHPQGGGILRAFPSLLLILSLALGSVVSGGCLAVPAVMLTSAAVTAAALVSEGERLVLYPDAESTAIVRNETDEESTCKQTCQRHEAPLERALPEV